MKHFLIATSFVIGLAGCVSETTGTNQTDGFVRVTDATSFAAAVADRRLEFSADTNVWFRLNSDGTMDGELRRGSVTGSWTFENGYWCREFEAGGRASEPDCQTAEISGSQLRLTRDQGAGDAGIWAIK